MSRWPTRTDALFLCGLLSMVARRVTRPNLPMPFVAGSRTTRPAVLAVVALLALTSSFLSPSIVAQTPAASSLRTSSSTDRLPVRRVVLYKSGVGYFEHLGRVRGNQTVAIDFTSGQLDDVLKSLTTLDLDGGRVSSVSYNSEAALDRRLGALRLPLGEQATRAQLLSALRGSKLQVGAGAGRVTGRLLSVERIDRKSGNGAVVQVDALSLVSDAGDLQTIALDPGVNVRIVEAGLNQEVGRYLALVASERDQDTRRLTIATAGTGERDLFVSYVSEVPVWKATYRLVLPTADAGRPLLQGWAIVDNTVGEDWNGVELSLVAGAPQSFIQQISRPYYVQRPVVPLPERMLLSPQTHQSALGTSGVGALAGTVTDAMGGAVPGATVRVTRNGAGVTDAVTDSPRGRYRVAGLAPGVYDVSISLPGFRTQSRSGVEVSGGMETVLNATLAVGGESEMVAVSGEGMGTVSGERKAAPRAAPAPSPPSGVGSRGRGGASLGRASGLAIDALSAVSATRAERVADAMSLAQVDATSGEVGDLFEYKLNAPVTIRKNQSALVPILGGEVKADKVSLWNPSTSGPRPLRAVWLTNTTGLTLDGGSFTVVEGQAFAGEGLIDPLKAGERRLLSYAMDLGVLVDAKGESVPTKVTRVQISRGLVIQQVEERQRRTYTARNEDTEPRTLVIEHPARAGWTLAGGVTAAETTPAWLRFRVPVAPKTTATFTVEEVHPLRSQYAINSITDQQVAVLVRDQAIGGPIEASLREVLARKAEIARLATEMGSRQGEIDTIGRDQQRVRENMQALKGSAEEKQLLQRYVKQLNDQESRLEGLRRELENLTAQQQKAQTELAAFIDGLAG